MGIQQLPMLISGTSEENVKLKKSSGASKMRLLPFNFVPGPFDVICARGNISQKHHGNIMFRKMVEDNIGPYSVAVTKGEKSKVVSRIVDYFRGNSVDGGFVKQKCGRWYEVGDRMAREKIGQGFRELLHTQYKSSHQAKKKRRREELFQLDDEMEKFVQSHCKDTIDNLRDISLLADDKISDDELQAQMNRLQIEIFQNIKQLFPRIYQEKQSDASESSLDEKVSVKIEDSDEESIVESPRKKKRNN